MQQSSTSQRWLVDVQIFPFLPVTSLAVAFYVLALPVLSSSNLSSLLLFLRLKAEPAPSKTKKDNCVTAFSSLLGNSSSVFYFHQQFVITRDHIRNFVRHHFSRGHVWPATPNDCWLFKIASKISQIFSLQ